jgi:hypothetical protein
LIGIGALVLTVLSMPSSGSSSSADNPALGKWVLVNAEDAAYCPTYQELTPSKVKQTQHGTTYSFKPVYDIKPGVTVVGEPGTTYMGEWRPTGPDEMTLGQVGPPPYGVPSFCKYHRK